MIYRVLVQRIIKISPHSLFRKTPSSGFFFMQNSSKRDRCAALFFYYYFSEDLLTEIHLKPVSSPNPSRSLARARIKPFFRKHLLDRPRPSDESFRERNVVGGQNSSIRFYFWAFLIACHISIFAKTINRTRSGSRTGALCGWGNWCFSRSKDHGEI